MRHAIMLAAVLVLGGVRHAQARAAARLPEVRQIGPETFAVLWKVPARDDLRLGLYLQLPDNCTPVSEPLRLQTADAYSSVPPWSAQADWRGGALPSTASRQRLPMCCAARTGRWFDTERAAGAICPVLCGRAVPSRFQAAALTSDSASSTS